MPNVEPVANKRRLGKTDIWCTAWRRRAWRMFLNDARHDRRRLQQFQVFFVFLGEDFFGDYVLKLRMHQLYYGAFGAMHTESHRVANWIHVFPRTCY